MKCSISTREPRPARPWIKSGGGGTRLGLGTTKDGDFDFTKRAMMGELGALLIHCLVSNHGNSTTVDRQTDASSFWCMIENTVRKKKYMKRKQVFIHAKAISTLEDEQAEPEL